jgi:hypothetical protein
VHRRWDRRGHLERGYPRFFINDRRVSLTRYVLACRKDERLPRYSTDEGRPARELPAAFVDAKRRARAKR